MIHLTYISLVIATVAHALYDVFNRLNNPIYHKFEVLMIVGYAAFFGLWAYMLYPMKKRERLWHLGLWAITFGFVRFSMYSSVWGWVAYKNPLYLGDGAWSDKLIKWVLYDLMNQGTGALGYLYIIVGIASFLMYLKIYYDQRA